MIRPRPNRRPWRRIAHRLASGDSAEDVHLYVLAERGGVLDDVAHLPHCGALILAGERERRARVVRMLRGELASRRSGTAAARVVVLVDGFELDSFYAIAEPGLFDLGLGLDAIQVHHVEKIEQLEFLGGVGMRNS